MKKKLFVFTIILLSLFVSIPLISKAYSNTKNIADSNQNLGHAKLTYIADNFAQLIADSPIIVEAIATEEQEELTYGNVPFVKSKIKIKQVLKGDSALADKEITLLQTKIVEDPIVKKNGHVLLFIKKYNGPIVQGAYTTMGLYQGHYNIDKDKSLSAALEVNDVEDFKDETYKLNKELNKIKNLQTLESMIRDKK